MLQGAIVVLGVSVIVFVVTRIIIDPAARMLGPSATDGQFAALRAELGFDRPLLQQFGDFLASLPRLDFGESLRLGVPARELVLDRLPVTIQLAAAGMLIATVVGITAGMIAARRPGSWLDQVTVTSSLVFLSLPVFWLGAMLIVVFAVGLGWFPTSGRGGPSHLVLPALALALPAAGRIAQITRSAVLDQMEERYVVAATAKGMGATEVFRSHVLRNAAVPIASITTWELVKTLAGASIIVETVFNYPGIGQLAVLSLQRGDIPVIQAVVFVIAFLVVAVNIGADVSYRMIDPRIRIS